MSTNSEIDDILDDIERTEGWRVEKVDGKRWKVFPPKPHDLILVSYSQDPFAIQNVRAQLRRAGYDDHRRQKSKQSKEAPTMATERKAVPSVVAIAHVSAPTPVEQIRAEFDVMMACMTRMGEQIQKIEDEQAGIAQLKQLLNTVLK